MNKKQLEKKLVLRKRIVATIDSKEMKEVQGGFSAAPHCPNPDPADLNYTNYFICAITLGAHCS